MDGIRPGERAGGVRELDDARRVGVVPTAFEAIGKATTRVRSELRLEVVEVEREIVVDAGEADDDLEILLQRQPGETFASWSSRCRPISSPRSSCRPSARVSRKLSDVM